MHSERIVITIEFVKSHDNPTGTVSGRLQVVDDGRTWPEGRFLAELNDVHPGFAAHVVEAVNAFGKAPGGASAS